MAAGRLDLEARNALLHEMTDEVAALVLRNNYLQPLSLSLSERRGLEDVGFQQRLMQMLEQRGELERAVEFLPDDAEIAERLRRSRGLSRPEIAVLLAYAKLSLYSDLLNSPVPDDPYLGRELGRYFPDVLSERYPDALEAHKLRREIIATQLANSMINRGGPSLILRIADQTGASAAEIAAAFAAARNAYDLPALYDEINALDGLVSGQVQLDLYAAVQDLLLDRLVWFLRYADMSRGLADVVARHREGVLALSEALDTILPEGALQARKVRAQALTSAGVPEGLAQRIADIADIAVAPDVVLVAGRTGQPIRSVAATLFAVRDHFKLGQLAAEAGGIAVSDYFDRLALDRALDGIGDAERRLTAQMVAEGAAGAAAVEAWTAPHKAQVQRVREQVLQIAESGLTLSKLAVAASLLGDLARKLKSPPQSPQCRKCRVPVNTIATSCSSAARITSSSRIEPPGWITALAPASMATSRPSANGKNASDATTEPCVSGAGRPSASAASCALRAAMRAESTRLIWPAPMPTVARSLA